VLKRLRKYLQRSLKVGDAIENECIGDLHAWETPVTFDTETDIIVLLSGNVSPTVTELTFYKE